MKGVLIASPASGSGKTTITAALIGALRKRGFTVQAFKCGPDFLDPAHHALLSGRPSHNLDTWMLPKETNLRIFASACRDADFAVIEGMMGLFDGATGSSEEGSTAEIAKLLGLPVLLVVDASSSARSVAALVHGFRTFDPEIRMAGVILNKVAGPAHAEMLTDALLKTCPDLPVGWLPQEKELHLEERYLGLQTASERTWTKEAIDLMASGLEQNFALEKLIERCQITLPALRDEHSDAPDAHVRIGVARDQAFCFYYEAGLDQLRKHGAEVVEFSPLQDTGLPDDLDAIYLGGGYPELYAETLANQKSLLADLREFAGAGKPVYGECGGLILLGRELITRDGKRWPMAGLLPLTIEMTNQLVHFGYVEMRFVEDGLAACGTALRGHSFHYSKIIAEETVSKTAMVHYSLSKDSELEGFAAGSVFGSYIHLHFASEPSFAARFVSLARSAREKCGVQS